MAITTAISNAAKLAWLKGDKSRHMIVIAYDDSQITLNGKPVLRSPMGGTFGSSKNTLPFNPSPWQPSHPRVA